MFVRPSFFKHLEHLGHMWELYAVLAGPLFAQPILLFAIPALGPLFGALSMWRLRTLPRARLMASGNR
jgi:hypothetical protein